MRPPFSPERWKRASQLVDEMLALPKEARASHLDRACAGDAELRADVEALLRAGEEAGSFLEEPAGGRLETYLQETLLKEEEGGDPLLGQAVGSWRLVRRLGRGGMGIVYLAERVEGEFQQSAALKVIRRGLDTDEILERFRRERQILARLQHPHIARLLDGGATPDGRPYFVMEYVEGEPITVYCDRLRAPVERRLGLFLDACDAVQHAHRSLVVHRDIKPSNILVTGDGQVKLLDFGIAKLMAEEGAGSDSELTRTGLRVMTPEYASPEQIRGEPATTATDVYGLGVVLYELLAARRPHRSSGVSSSELEKSILESQPDAPSRAAGGSGGGEAPPGSPGPEKDPGAEAAEKRGTTPERLRRRLRGDLDTIVLTALRKEPERRYQGPGALAEDLRRHLRGLPVEARKDVWSYRARKFLSRHRVGIAAAALVFLSLVAGLAGVTWQSRRAALEARKAGAVKDFLISVFEVAAPSQSMGEKITARELLDRGQRRVDTELAGQPEIQAEIFGVLGEIYGELGMDRQGEPLLKRAVEMERSLHGEDHPEVAAALERWGISLWGTGKYRRAARVEEEALALRRRILRPGDPQIAVSLGSLAAIYHDLGDAKKALALHREALSIDEASFGRRSDAVATDLMNIGNCLSDLQQYDEAERLLREALEIRRKIFPASHPEVADSLHTLAALLSARGEFDEAERLYREALEIRRKVLGPDHPDVALTLSNLENLLQKKGDYAAAVPIAKEALEIRRKVLGPDHPDFAVSLNNYATLCFRTENYDESEKAFREALEIWEKQLGPDHPNVASGWNNLGMVLMEKGNLPEAERLIRRGLEARRKLKGEESPAVAQSLRNLGLVNLERGHLEEAEASLTRSLAIARKVYPPEHPRLAEVLLTLGRLRSLQGRFPDAVTLFQEALKINTEKTGNDSPQSAEAEMRLGAALSRVGHGEEAEELLRGALEIRRRRFGEGSWQTAEAACQLGACLLSRGKSSEAKTLLRSGYGILLSKRGRDDLLTREAAEALHRIR